MTSQSIYYYEGETEKALITALKRGKLIPQGKTKKFNFWQKEASVITRSINKSDVLYIVFDTDVMGIIERNRFIKNIESLCRSVKEVHLLAHHENLEDELVFVCSKRNSLKLFEDFYNTKNCDEFKSSFIKESNLLKKLNDNSFNINKLWSKQDVYSGYLSGIKTNKKITKGV